MYMMTHYSNMNASHGGETKVQSVTIQNYRAETFTWQSLMRAILLVSTLKSLTIV